MCLSCFCLQTWLVCRQAKSQKGKKAVFALQTYQLNSNLTSVIKAANFSSCSSLVPLEGHFPFKGSPEAFELKRTSSFLVSIID